MATVSNLVEYREQDLIRQLEDLLSKARQGQLDAFCAVYTDNGEPCWTRVLYHQDCPLVIGMLTQAQFQLDRMARGEED